MSATVIPLRRSQKATRQALRPPRTTYAGVCIWCAEPDCEHPECVALHEISEWRVCRFCGGSGQAFSNSLTSTGACSCAFGLALVAPMVYRLRPSPGSRGSREVGHWSSYWDAEFDACYHQPLRPARLSTVDPAPECMSIAEREALTAAQEATAL
ncbi:hypothetical protein ACFVJ5_11290 [Nocardia sp. NPDC127606]|uniref:hypothetical protein n=1 Tax=Nocardia sp. NPDC127606 TaxID=3345406 RepID=UPI003625A7AB